MPLNHIIKSVEILFRGVLLLWHQGVILIICFFNGCNSLMAGEMDF